MQVCHYVQCSGPESDNEFAEWPGGSAGVCGVARAGGGSSIFYETFYQTCGANLRDPCLLIKV